MKRLLVRAPNWVGDLVMATPVLRAALVDPRFEDVRIVVRRHLAPLLDGPEGPEPGRLLMIERRARGGPDPELALLRAARADGALLLSNSFGSALRAFRAGIAARAGAALSRRGFLLTHKLVPPTLDGRRVPIPTAHLLRDVAGLFGIRPRALAPELSVTNDARRRTNELLARQGLAPGDPFVLCAPSAAFGAAKLWPPEAFARALDLLHETLGWPALVTGGPGEEPALRAVVGACRHPARSLEDEERDLSLLKPLVAASRLLVVGDSGPRWIAAAFGVPCVSVMGPNFPALTASSLERCIVVRRDDLECAPCLERVCPLGHHRCLTGLEPERVVAAALRLLEAERDRTRPTADSAGSATLAGGGVGR